MMDDQKLEEYLLICFATHDALRAQGKWPWPDSTDEDNLVESEDTPKLT